MEYTKYWINLVVVKKIRPLFFNISCPQEIGKVIFAAPSLPFISTGPVTTFKNGGHLKTVFVCVYISSVLELTNYTKLDAKFAAFNFTHNCLKEDN